MAKLSPFSTIAEAIAKPHTKDLPRDESNSLFYQLAMFLYVSAELGKNGIQGALMENGSSANIFRDYTISVPSTLDVLAASQEQVYTDNEASTALGITSDKKAALDDLVARGVLELSRTKRPREFDPKRLAEVTSYRFSAFSRAQIIEKMGTTDIDSKFFDLTFDTETHTIRNTIIDDISLERRLNTLVDDPRYDDIMRRIFLVLTNDLTLPIIAEALNIGDTTLISQYARSGKIYEATKTSREWEYTKDGIIATLVMLEITRQTRSTSSRSMHGKLPEAYAPTLFFSYDGRNLRDIGSSPSLSDLLAEVDTDSPTYTRIQSILDHRGEYTLQEAANILYSGSKSGYRSLSRRILRGNFEDARQDEDGTLFVSREAVLYDLLKPK